VLRLALTKAQAAGKQADANTIVLGADTTVLLDGQVFEKPSTQLGATEMLEQLSGKTHLVLTGTGIVTRDRTVSSVTQTSVTFRSLSKLDIESYIATKEPFGKAGAYAIQGRAAAFIKHIQGSYSNVVGLPLYETASLLAQVGMDVMNLDQSGQGG